MRDQRTLGPEMVSELFGGRTTISGAAKMVFIGDNRDQKSIFCGVSIDKLGQSENWQMVAGTMIFVPLRRWEALPDIEGWDMCDILIEGGLDQTRYWRETTLEGDRMGGLIA